jgi:excisionase family DNA binding protein
VKPETSVLAASDRLLEVTEAAAALRVSERTIVTLAEQGYLERVKIFRSTRYRASDVEALIRSGTRGRLS